MERGQQPRSRSFNLPDVGGSSKKRTGTFIRGPLSPFNTPGLNKPRPLRFIFVWDMDETLSHYDDGTIFTGEPLYYLHPLARVWLKFCNGVENSTTILWSKGQADYVHDVVFRHGLTFFDHILTYDECAQSMDTYNVYKSYEFLVKHLNLPTSPSTLSVLIDDMALANSAFDQLAAEDTYTHIIQPPPFDAEFIINYMNNKIDPYYNYVTDNLINFYILSKKLNIKNHTTWKTTIY